jgi:2-polyprenyl-3-methyl-5-hydroxy-6-metoxy-1,4-benzoquinol methylase
LNDFSDLNRTAWETRSHLLGASLRSVLFKGLPDVVNEHLHHWHKKVILGCLQKKEGLKILDAGCGYGRLSIPILETFPNLDITGIDISEKFVELYKENTHHPAFVGTLEKIPAALGTFDYILCITVLMYLEGDSLKKAISNLLFHLEQGGKLILIEPHQSGRFFLTGFGVLTFLRSRIGENTLPTTGRSFRMNEIEHLFGRAGGKVLSEWRLPITSLCILPLTLIGIFLPSRWAKGICRMVSSLDALLGIFKLPSLHVAYVITRN